MARFSFVSTLDSMPWGGSELLWTQTAAHLREQGHEVAVSVHWWPQIAAPILALERAGCTMQFRRIRERQRIIAKTFSRPDPQAHLIESFLRQTAPDLAVLSFECQTPGIEWMEACSRQNIAYAFVVQAAVERLWPPDHVNLPYSKAVEKAKGQFFVSQGNLEWVRKQLALSLPQAKVVRNPFTVAYDAAPPWPSEGSTLRLACVGRLDPPSKGQDILLEVLKSEKWKERDIHITLFGSGAHEKSLRALCALWELKNVSFGGHTCDVEAIWRDHHALILPSRVEGLPLVIVEALLCGRPCIVTDVAGNAELVQDNETGFVAKAPIAEFVAEALERAWSRRGDLEAMGYEGARRVRGQVPRDPSAVFAAQLLDLLP